MQYHKLIPSRRAIRGSLILGFEIPYFLDKLIYISVRVYTPWSVDWWHVVAMMEESVKGYDDTTLWPHSEQKMESGGISFSHEVQVKVVFCDLIRSLASDSISLI